MENNNKNKKEEKGAPKLANQRTNLAVERTILANARTFSAWVRTGLSSVLAGLAIVGFIGDSKVFRGYVLFIGILFSLIGIATYILAFIGFKRSFDKLNAEIKEIPNYLFFLMAITIGMIIAAILIMGLLIFYQ